MPYSDELNVIVQGLDSIIGGLDHGTPEEIEMAEAIKVRAEALKAMPEEDLAELVEQAQLMLANLDTEGEA